jgi:hypothetical protein
MFAPVSNPVLASMRPDRLESTRDVVTEKEHQKPFTRPTPTDGPRTSGT